MIRNCKTPLAGLMALTLGQGAQAQTVPDLPDPQAYCLGAAMAAPIWEDVALQFRVRTEAPADLDDGTGAPVVLEGQFIDPDGPFTLWAFGTSARDPGQHRTLGTPLEVEDGMALLVSPDGRYELTVNAPASETRGVRLYFEVQPNPGACADILEDWLTKDGESAGPVHDMLIERIAAMRRLDACGLGTCTWSQLSTLE